MIIKSQADIKNYVITTIFDAPEADRANVMRKEMDYEDDASDVTTLEEDAQEEVRCNMPPKSPVQRELYDIWANQGSSESSDLVRGNVERWPAEVQ